MSYRIVALALVSGCLAFGQRNQGSADRIDLKQQAEAVAATATAVVGNEKTVGGNPQVTNVRRSDDSNAVGNSKTVGGAASYLDARVPVIVETVGNSKTVGGR